MGEKRKKSTGKAKKSFTQKHQRRSTTRKIHEMVEGTVQMSREGFGFVIVPDREDDIFIPQKYMLHALNGDQVMAAVTRKKDAKHRAEGEIVAIVERSKKPFIGILQIMGQRGWVIVESRNMPYDTAPSLLTSTEGMSVSTSVAEPPVEAMLWSIVKTRLSISKLICERCSDITTSFSSLLSGLRNILPRLTLLPFVATVTFCVSVR